MDSVNNLLVDGLKDFRAAIDQGKQTPRNYNSDNSKPYTPDAARFRLVIYFNDGRKRWFPSFDNVHNFKEVHTDEWNGIKKLIGLVENRYKGQFKNAVIYSNLDEKKQWCGNYEYEIIKWNFAGIMKQAKFINFMKSKDNKSILFDCNRLKMYGSKKIV